MRKTVWESAMYDARKSPGIGAENIAFGVITLLVIALAFVGVWFATSGNDRSGTVSASAAIDTGGALAQRMTSSDERRYLAALARLDPDAIDTLEAEFSTGNLSRAEEIEAISRSSGRAILQNLDALPHASVRDINALIDTALNHMRMAQGSGHAMCRASTLMSLSERSPGDVERWIANQGFDETMMYAVGMSYQADFLEMLARARFNPSRHGTLNASDQRAFQNLGMVMMGDPAIMEVMMTGGNDRNALARVDVCRAGVAFLQAVRDLPDRTKGRAWAAMFETTEFQNALSQASQFGF